MGQEENSRRRGTSPLRWDKVLGQPMAAKTNDALLGELIQEVRGIRQDIKAREWRLGIRLIGEGQ